MTDLTYAIPCWCCDDSQQARIVLVACQVRHRATELRYDRSKRVPHRAANGQVLENPSSSSAAVVMTFHQSTILKRFVQGRLRQWYH
ncbi:hypothetical protein PoB_004543100 [Plakobranchus ocellatus]|uniref:Uncharacterized protein n=1 Tax=Plakobranchus ocellatus TaxID=259542 RepID=A0AAV4B6B9_9GAST|nr:hypothetical protein PoB_004543100 [Plakobranchus ocellatus]